jgi:hypothetical protein
MVMDPDIDFAEHMSQFDTFLIGRKMFEAIRPLGSDAPPAPGIQKVRARSPSSTRSCGREWPFSALPPIPIER